MPCFVFSLWLGGGEVKSLAPVAGMRRRVVLVRVPFVPICGTPVAQASTGYPPHYTKYGAAQALYPAPDDKLSLFGQCER